MADDESTGAGRFDHGDNQSSSGDAEETRRVQGELFNGPAAAKHVDYLALGGVGARRNIALPSGFAHHPGCTQGCDARLTGPAGCTLFRVDEHRNVQSTFVPTSVVRWEHFDITVNEQTTLDSLREMFKLALSGCRPEAGEQVWVVRWTLRGRGPTFDLLDDASTQRQFIESVEQNDGSVDAPRRLHSICLLPGGTSAETLLRRTRWRPISFARWRKTIGPNQ